jgi:hypothetical protein
MSLVQVTLVWEVQAVMLVVAPAVRLVVVGEPPVEHRAEVSLAAQRVASGPAAAVAAVPTRPHRELAVVAVLARRVF